MKTRFTECEKVTMADASYHKKKLIEEKLEKARMRDIQLVEKSPLHFAGEGLSVTVYKKIVENNVLVKVGGREFYKNNGNVEVYSLSIEGTYPINKETFQNIVQEFRNSTKDVDNDHSLLEKMKIFFNAGSQYVVDAAAIIANQMIYTGRDLDDDISFVFNLKQDQPSFS